jgi:hypothetical protein
MTLKKQKPKGEISSLLQNKPKTTSVSNFKVSFSDVDSTQKYGSGFKDWQKEGLLSQALERLTGMCKRPLLVQVNGDTFSIYGDWPPRDRCLFDLPAHVTEDAKWARIHINGRSVIIGHVIDDTFYVVFLDKSHAFYLTGNDSRRSQFGRNKAGKRG